MNEKIVVLLEGVARGFATPDGPSPQIYAGAVGG